MPSSLATPLDEMLATCAVEIERRAQMAFVHARQLREGAAALQAAAVNARPLATASITVPVVDVLATAAPSPLLQAVLDAKDEIAWIASPRLDDGGTEAALAPLNDVRDFGDVTVGLLLVAPNQAYPEHSHPPQELYLPISGDGQWRYGGNEFVEHLAPNALVYNRPHDVHAIYAGNDPVLALYVLWP